MLDSILSLGTAGVITAVITGIIAWFTARRKYKSTDREYYETQNSLLQLQKQRLVRRNGKLLALNMSHSSHQIMHRNQYKHLISLCRDNYIETALQRLHEYAGEADEDANKMMADLMKISDISEAAYHENDHEDDHEEEAGNDA